MTKKKEATIYGLFGPDGVIRYIGQTRNNPVNRLQCHISTARRGDNSAKSEWIRSVNYEVQFAELASTDNPNEEERNIIARFRGDGADLLNVADGGNAKELNPILPIDRAVKGMKPPRPMLGPELENWREAMRLSESGAATILDVRPSDIARWESGEVAIPHVVALACRALFHRLEPWPD